MIHTTTGVSSRNMVTRFANVDYLNGVYWAMGVAGRLVENDEKMNNDKNLTDTKEVRSIRIAEFINSVVGQRKIPENRGKGAVVMKLDVEGKELEVIPDLVMSGALQYLDQIHIDWTRDPLVDWETANMPSL